MGADNPLPTVSGVVVEGRLGRSWRLLTASWALVLGDRGLRRFALLGAAVWIAASVAFFLALARLLARPGRELEIVALSVLAYYPFTLLGVCVGVGLVAGAADLIDGRPPTVRGMAAVVRARFRQIAAWSLLVAGVGVLLDQVVRRLPWGGRLARTVLGAAWAVVTLFAVPILATEGCDARTCLRRSARTFKDRWGEATAGSVSIFAVVVLFSIPACMAVGAGVAAIGSGAGAWAYVALLAGAIALTGAGYAGLVMREMFAFGLLRYVHTGTVGGGFRENDLLGAIRPKGAGRQKTVDPAVQARLGKARRLVWLGFAVYAAVLLIAVVLDPGPDWIIDGPVVGAAVLVAIGATKAAAATIGQPTRRIGYSALALAAALQIVGILGYLLQTARDAGHHGMVGVWLVGVLLSVPLLLWLTADARVAARRHPRRG